MNSSKYRLIAVTPVYEDVEASGRLFMELAANFGKDIFVVAVDDGSIRQPLGIENLQKAGLDGVVLKLQRNVGHQRAIAIGLSYTQEFVLDNQKVVVLDSDGEDLPSSIQNLLAGLDDQHTDVVVAQRKSRVETFRFKLFYEIYKRVFKFLTGRTISFGNFMALKAHAVRRLVKMQELSIHVAGAVIASKLRVGVCPLDRGPRYAGQSKMNFVGLVLHGFKGLMVFAEDVLIRVGIACAIIAIISIIGVVLAIILKIIGFASPGWFSVALGILILMFLQTGALTLMTLMLTGVVRSGTVASTISYHDFVEQVFHTSNVEG